MYFTDSPHLQSIEAAMKMIPRHPLTQDAEQKGSSMKEDTFFLYYIDSFQWINTADPSENEDILESLRMCTAV